MPTRILRDGILDSEQVDALSVPAELFYRRLMSVVDDFGRYECRYNVLRAKVFPLRVDSVTEQDVCLWIQECVEAGLLATYSAGGRDYLEILNFGQRVRPGQESKYPENPASRGNSREVPEYRGKLQKFPATRARSTSTTTTPPNTTSTAPEAETCGSEGQTSGRFPEWWEIWSASRGTNHHDHAARAWLSVVTVDLEDAVFECTRSYLASRDGPAGYNPENFLFDQARDAFRARWPPPRAKPESKDEQRQKALNRLMASNLERLDGKRATKEIHTTRS